MKRVGIVGGRGYVGQELVSILARHPKLELTFVASSSRAGEPVQGAPNGLVFSDSRDVGDLATQADAIILGLPNGEATEAARVVGRVNPAAVIVDISADHRFDDAWTWGVPELNRASISSSKRIANPGCYATAAAFAVAPMAELCAAPPHVFGVSGYSGAGATPSPRNDVEVLRDNVVAYALTGHTHEREVSRHVAPVFFMPHVASFFRGVVVTASMTLKEPITKAALAARFAAAYAHEPLVTLSDEPPLVRDTVGTPRVVIGGFAVDEARRHAVVVAALDNLLKGAASQAIQNVNLALGLGELTGIEPWPR